MRRLIVNADDFGRSAAINEAVFRAHREGVLTTASLMVSGEACQEAVAFARANPALGVGLHLVLLCGRSVLPPSQIPGLTDARQGFSDNPVATGCRYFFLKSLREQLRREIAAQFSAFQATGLPLDHVNGHLNIHLHPVVFDLLMAQAQACGIRHLRLTRDKLRLNLRLAGGAWLYRLSHALIFTLLSLRSRGALRRREIRHTDAVFGLLQNSRVDETYVTRLLPCLPAGDFELYSHPAARPDTLELLALLSPRVKSLIRELDIRLIRYQDLDHG
jgi:chitin disaccharide deacetylase